MPDRGLWFWHVRAYLCVCDSGCSHKLFSSLVDQGHGYWRCSCPTMFKHLLAIRDGHKTDFQQNTRTLPPFLFVFLHPVPVPVPVPPSFQRLCSPPIPPFSFSLSLSLSLFFLPLLFIPPSCSTSSLPLWSCTWFLPEKVQFPQTLGGRGMLSGSCRLCTCLKLYGSSGESLSA